MNRAELARFTRNYRVAPSGCWLWIGPRRPGGYGKHRLGPGHPERSAHVLSFEHFHGPVPEGLQVDHACHTAAVQAGLCPGGECAHRRCVNPDHLEVVTPGENTKRQAHANRAKDSCPHGHLYTPENTQIGSDGKRRCRACRRSRVQTL